MTAIYLPVSFMGYITYGDSIKDSIINSIQTIWMQETINICITFHCILTLTLIFNPMNQEIEEILNVPQEFCLKRVIVRSATMAAVVFVAETLPHFGPLVDLIGGSTLTLTSLIFPCILYLYLITDEKVEKYLRDKTNKLSTITKGLEPRNITIYNVIETVDKPTLYICGVIIGFALVGGISASVSAIMVMSGGDQFVPPCYVSYFVEKYSPSKILGVVHGTTNCCGFNRNISIYHNASKYCS